MTGSPQRDAAAEPPARDAASPPPPDAAEMLSTPDDAARDQGGGTALEASHPDGTVDGPPTLPTRDGPPPQSAPTLPGLVLWLDAEKGITTVGDKVSRWEDQSPEKNHALMDTAGWQPTLVKTASGLPAVHFTGKKVATNTAGDGGSYLRIKDAASLNWGGGDFTMVVVTNYNNALDGTHNGAFGTFYGKNGSGGTEILFCGNWPFTETVEQAVVRFHVGEGLHGIQTVRRGLNDGKVRVYTMRRIGERLEARINGLVDGSRTTPITNLLTTGNDAAVGSYSARTGTRSLLGDIFALIAVKGSTPDQTVSDLEAYLVAHYHAAP